MIYTSTDTLTYS